MSSVEVGPDGAVAGRDAANLDQIKQELAQREHSYPDGRTRPVGMFARAARIILIVWCVEVALQGVMVAGFLLAPASLPGVFYEIGGDPRLNVAVLSDWLILLTGLAAFVMVGRFTYRAQKNLFTIGSPYAKMPPGWTVGWYFIPLASLWQPVLGMSQIYRGSQAAVGEKAGAGALIPVWWGAWLVRGVPSWFLGIWSGSPLMSFVLLMGGAGLSILTGVCLIRILSDVETRQDMLGRGGVATVFD